MPNLHRGEIEAVFDGRPMTLCLTLGALAELEASFGDEDMLALANRFASGRLSARDAIRVLGAGLRGGGNDVADSDVARLQAEGGAAGFVEVVAKLLTATFGAGHATSAGVGDDDAAPGRGDADTGPFPGRR